MVFPPSSPGGMWGSGPTCPSSMYLPQLEALGKKQKTGIRLASNTRHPGSGEWRVDVAVMGERSGLLCPIVYDSPRHTLTLHWSAVMGAYSDL